MTAKKDEFEAIRQGIYDAWSERLEYSYMPLSFENIMVSVEKGVKEAFSEYLEKHGLPDQGAQ